MLQSIKMGKATLLFPGEIPRRNDQKPNWEGVAEQPARCAGRVDLTQQRSPFETFKPCSNIICSNVEKFLLLSPDVANLNKSYPRRRPRAL